MIAEMGKGGWCARRNRPKRSLRQKKRGGGVEKNVFSLELDRIKILGRICFSL